MANSSSSSPEAPPGSSDYSVEYVGFWKRVVASLIDVFILTVIAVPLLLAIYGRSYLALTRTGGGIAGFWDFMIQYVLPAIAVIVFWRYRGATPGKMAISAKIVDARTGRAPSTARLIVRYFAYLVSMLPLMLGFVWIAFDKRKQGFHDKIAGTVVIDEESVWVDEVLKGARYVCANCGYQGSGKKFTKGNLAIEIILWIFFLIPGLIYSIWRLSTRYVACPKCGAPNLVPTSSPRGKKLLEEFK